MFVFHLLGLEGLCWFHKKSPKPKQPQYFLTPPWFLDLDYQQANFWCMNETDCLSQIDLHQPVIIWQGPLWNYTVFVTLVAWFEFCLFPKGLDICNLCFFPRMKHSLNFAWLALYHQLSCQWLYITLSCKYY